MEARELRQHSEEYEKLRQAAMAFPKCSDMAAEIAMEEAALTSARSAAGSAARTVELRKKQFALLLQTISSLTDDMEGPPEDAAVNVAPDGAAAMETDN